MLRPLLSVIVCLATAAAPPGAGPVFATLNNVRATGVANVWLRAGAPALHRLDEHNRAVGMLALPTAYGIVCAGPDGSHVSVLVCHRRPRSHLVRVCLWSGELGAEERREYLALVARWHAEHVSRDARLLLRVEQP